MAVKPRRITARQRDLVRRAIELAAREQLEIQFPTPTPARFGPLPARPREPAMEVHRVTKGTR